MKFNIKRAKKGDVEAFVELMEMNKSYMYKVAKSILNNDEDVADAIQETILSCYKNIESLKKANYFKTWMTRILINKCNDIIKTSKKIIYINPEENQVGSYEEDIEEKMFLRQCFDSLKPDYKIIMTMYYSQGFNTKEIGGILNINESTVRTKMSRGRDYLKKYYLKMYREA